MATGDAALRAAGDRTGSGEPLGFPLPAGGLGVLGLEEGTGYEVDPGSTPRHGGYSPSDHVPADRWGSGRSRHVAAYATAGDGGTAGHSVVRDEGRLGRRSSRTAAGSMAGPGGAGAATGREGG